MQKIILLIAACLMLTLSALNSAQTNNQSFTIKTLSETPPPKITTGTLSSEKLDEILGDTMQLFRVTERLPNFFYISTGEVLDFYDLIEVELPINDIIAQYIAKGYEPTIISLLEMGGQSPGLLFFESDETVINTPTATMTATFGRNHFSVNEFTKGENLAIFTVVFFKVSTD